MFYGHALEPSVLVARVFSNEGPRGDWKESNSGSHMVKVLEAGNFGLMGYRDETNDFLRSLGLPEANFIQQPEFEDILKSYFILSVPKSEWKEKIEGARGSQSRMQEIMTLAAKALENIPRQ